MAQHLIKILIGLKCILFFTAVAYAQDKTLEINAVNVDQLQPALTLDFADYDADLEIGWLWRWPFGLTLRTAIGGASTIAAQTTITPNFDPGISPTPSWAPWPRQRWR